MLNFKSEIAKKIAQIVKIEASELETYIEIPKDSTNGDFSFPCFRLAKELKKAPQVIASEIKEKLELEESNDIIEKIDVIGGYLNFYINKNILIKEVLSEINKEKENYGASDIGKGKNIIVEYSSPNIAKEFHIGHLRTTVIGAAFYNIYKYLGYNTIGINHLGDYGTQFGKMIEGYKRWGEEYNLEENPIEELTKMYIRINDLCKSDEDVLNACRENFRKLEEGDKECIELWNKFKDLSLKEFYKTYDMLGVKFDSLNGESFYSDKMPEVIEILEKTGKLVESQGARIVDLEDKGINTPCIIEKTNGSTTYATRDLAAILYRARTYDFDKCIYVVAYEQNLHFKQVFEVAKLLGLDKKYTDGLTHIAYGMTRLATGRMSTREGNVVKVNELLEESVKRVLDIINEKTPEMEDKEDNARKIGIGAVIFNNLCTNLIKDQIFDWNIVLNFNGETGPYIQYIYVRTKSVLEKASYMPNLEDVDFSLLEDEKSFYIIKKIYEFNNILKQVIEKNETSILARYLIELAQGYSNFYNDNKIIVEDKKVQDARLYLTYAVGNVLKIGMKLLGIEMPTKM
ncbi:MAG: arginine--tRNA ligase [Clostridia bacterium]